MLLDHLEDLEARLIEHRHALPVAGDACGAITALRQVVLERLLDPLFGGELLFEQGEVVDSQSRPDQRRHAFDLLLCQRHGPRLRRDGAPTACLAEAVVATLSLAPVLDEAVVRQAVRAARSIKQLQRSGLRAPGSGPLRDTEPVPLGAPAAGAAGLPAIPCHLLAFDGPSQMSVVHGWLKQAYFDAGIAEADMPDSGAERCQVASPALDGIFVLGRGFLNFDNMPWGFFDDPARMMAFGACWVVADTERGSLTSLFLQLQLATTAMAGTRIDPRPYSTAFSVPSLRLGN